MSDSDARPQVDVSNSVLISKWSLQKNVVPDIGGGEEPALPKRSILDAGILDRAESPHIGGQRRRLQRQYHAYKLRR
jgi:hypothetical protein